MRKTIWTSMLLVAALTIAYGAGGTLTADERNQTIQELEKAMTSEYAFPDVAAKAVSALQEHVKAHDYESIGDGKEFATRLTKDLNAVCHDAHLHLEYSETPLPVRKERSTPSPEEIKAGKEWVRYVNSGFTKVERLDGNIGYLSFRNFMNPETAKRPVKAAMEFLADSDALIIDIRQNGGGSPETVQLICSYFFGDKPVHLNDLVARDGQREEFWTLKKVDGPRYLDKDIYVLTSKHTASAAEEFSYNLKNLKRATIVGESTWGGANPGGMYRLNDHFNVFLPRAHAESPITHTNWEGAGVQPDVAVDPNDGLSVAYKMALKKEIDRTTDSERKAMLEEVLKKAEAGKGN